MKPKWYFSILLVALAVFGVCQEQSVVPNQEIVLQFANNTKVSGYSQKAITVIKKQLQAIDAKNINVRETKNGRLKITYFSNNPITSVKQYLALSTTSKDVPNKKDLGDYRFDVFEIQKQSEVPSGFGGKYIVELKQDYDRSSNPNPELYSLPTDNNYNCYNLKTAVQLNKAITVLLDSTSYNIPEVRAGPIA